MGFPIHMIMPGHPAPGSRHSRTHPLWPPARPSSGPLQEWGVPASPCEVTLAEDVEGEGKMVNVWICMSCRMAERGNAKYLS